MTASNQVDDQYRTMFERSADAILIVDGEKFIDCNAAALNMFGAGSEGDIIGKPPALISPEYQPDGRNSGDASAEAIGIAIENASHRFEWVHERLNGEEFWAEVTLTTFEVGGELRLHSQVRDITEQKMIEETNRQQSEAILEMSTPVIRVWDDILLMPLVGIVDTLRAQQILETLLEEIVASESQIVILDVTGVPLIDTSIARHLMKTVEAARMLGAEVIITGFSPDAAQTLTQLNVDFSTLRTKGSLKTGMEMAFSMIRKTSDK